MSRPNWKETPRARVLVAVLMLHAALITVMLLAPGIATRSGEPAVPIVLIDLPVQIPTVRVRLDRPQHITTNVPIAQAPPLLPSSALAGPSSGTDRGESGVDWAAEAYRAIRAFEIRRDQTSNRALSVASSPDYSPQRAHRAGQRTKTANGDWIVWINADCYQVAAWHAGLAADPALPETVCLHDKESPPGE
jgi:hypothetical protein